MRARARVSIRAVEHGGRIDTREDGTRKDGQSASVAKWQHMYCMT